MLLDAYAGLYGPGNTEPGDTAARQHQVDLEAEREELVDHAAFQLIEEVGRRGPLHTWGAAEVCRFVLHAALDDEDLLP